MPSREQKRIKEKLKKPHSSEMTSVDRKKNRHPIYWVLSVLVLGVIAVSFLAGPMIGSFRSSNRLIFGYYNDEAIEFKPDSYFSRQRDLYAEQLQQMQGDNNDNLQWQALQVWKGAYEQTLIHTAILQQAERSGLHISEKEVDRALAKYGPYMENGEFSPEKYRNTSNAQKYSTRQLFKENLIHDRWMQDYTGIPGSDAEKSFFKKMASPERKIRYISYHINDYPAEEVRSYGESNPTLFRRIELSRISLKTEKKEAEELLRQLEAAPQRFEELARNHSTDAYADKGGEMGTVRYHELLGSLEKDTSADEIFSLQEGDHTGLLKTGFGYSIYRCDSKARDADLSDEQTISDIRSYLISNERGKVEDYFLEKASGIKASAADKGFAAAASEEGLESSETGYFPINYGNAVFLPTLRESDEAGIVQSAFENERVLKILFSTGEKEITEPFVLGSSILLASVVDEREAEKETLERIEGLYSYLIQNYRRTDIRNTFLDSEKHEDNFMSVFSRYFMNS
jgi:peptidyl-prolyl cis-trans isomerase D